MIIDLEHCKNIHDDFAQGTDPRRAAPHRRLCQDTVREEGTLRPIDGEEFAVRCPGTGPSHASQILDRLQLHFASKSNLESPDEVPIGIKVNVSAGIALLDGNAPIEESLRRAEVVLCEGKLRALPGLRLVTTG